MKSYIICYVDVPNSKKGKMSIGNCIMTAKSTLEACILFLKDAVKVEKELDVARTLVNIVCLN